MKYQKRFTPGPVRFRADVEGKAPEKFLEGYAAAFGAESAVMFDEEVTDEDGEPIPFVEVLDPGVFDRTLRENPDVRALFNHDTSKILGRVKPGTLRLTVDDHGLAFVNELPDTQAGRDARVSVKRGDIDGCSFGFYVLKDNVELRPGKPARRTLFDVELFEVSPAVTFPAYVDTEVSVRGRLAMARREATPKTFPRRAHALRRLRILELAGR